MSNVLILHCYISLISRETFQLNTSVVLYLLWLCTHCLQWYEPGQSQQFYTLGPCWPGCWQLSDLCGCSSSVQCRPSPLQSAQKNKVEIKELLLLHCEIRLEVIISLQKQHYWNLKSLLLQVIKPCFKHSWTLLSECVDVNDTGSGPLCWSDTTELDSWHSAGASE